MLEQKHFRGIEYFCMFICCVLPLARYNMQRLVIHLKKIMRYRIFFFNYDAHVTTYKLDVFISENEFYSYVSSGKFIFSMAGKKIAMFLLTYLASYFVLRFLRLLQIFSNRKIT